MFDGRTMAAEVVKTVRDYVAKATDPIKQSVADLDERIKAIPAGPAGPEGATGATGATGEPGKDADPQVIKQMVADEVKQMDTDIETFAAVLLSKFND